jgi:hypothetical protein
VAIAKTGGKTAGAPRLSQRYHQAISIRNSGARRR